MGTVAGVHCPGHGDGLFVDQSLLECAKAFTTIPESRRDFVRFIKDGYWVDYLPQTEILRSRSLRAKVAEFDVTFGSPRRAAAEGNLRASISSSTKSAKSYETPELRGSFDEMYASVERRTCFAQDSIQAFLYSITCPLYLENCKNRSSLLQGEDEPVDDDELRDLGSEESEMHRLQEILLSSAAFSDEIELECSLSTPSWLGTLTAAINDCSHAVIICRVDATPAGCLFPAVLVNAAAHRRHAARLAFSPRDTDLCGLWQIDADESTRAAMDECLRRAQPVRLFSHHAKDLRSSGSTHSPSPTTPTTTACASVRANTSARSSASSAVAELSTRIMSGKITSSPPKPSAGSRPASLGAVSADSYTHSPVANVSAVIPTTVLDITHIFDTSGAHRYVLGILADGVDPRNLDREVRVLADSALLIAHVIKPPVLSGGRAACDGAGTGQNDALALLCAKSKRDLGTV
jgi:hypothetical protein